MNKVQFRYIKTGICAFALLATMSCQSDFLKEELTTQRSNAYYSTDEGIQAAVTGAYNQTFNVPLSGEVQFATTNYGTDEFHVGGDGSNSPWNNYDGGFRPIVTVVTSNTIAAERAWDTYYIAIGLANQIVKSATESKSTSNAIKKTALGEGYFLRAFNYLRLVRQYGAVPLKLSVSTTVELEFTRESPDKVYAQIIDDSNSRTLIACSTLDKSIKLAIPTGRTCDASRIMGEKLAELSLKKKITKIVFDRGPYIYHGRVKALADGARAGGLQF